MKKLLLFILGMLVISQVQANNLDSNQIQDYLKTSQVETVSDAYSEQNVCESERTRFNREYPSYTRSACFLNNSQYFYFICGSDFSCNLENISELQKQTSQTGTPNVALQTNSQQTTNLNIPNKSKLDTFLKNVQKKGESFNDDAKYDRFLDALEKQLTTLKNKYSKNTTIQNMTNYLISGVENIRIQKSQNQALLAEKTEVEKFFCELAGDETCENKSQTSTGNTTNTGNIIPPKTNPEPINTTNRYPGCDTDDIVLENGQIWSACNVGATKAGTDRNSLGYYFLRDEGDYRFTAHQDPKNKSNILANNLNYKKIVQDWSKNPQGVCAPGYVIPSIEDWKEALKTEEEKLNLIYKSSQNLEDYSISKLPGLAWVDGYSERYFNPKIDRLAQKLLLPTETQWCGGGSCVNNGNYSIPGQNTKYHSSSKSTAGKPQGFQLNKIPYNLGTNNKPHITDHQNNILTFVSRYYINENNGNSQIRCIKAETSFATKQCDFTPTYGLNASNKECKSFSSSCLPEGFTKVENCESVVTPTTTSEIINNNYRLTTKKYDGLFMRENKNVCEEEFGSEWRVSEVSPTGIIQTAKNEYVWNTIQKERNCNNSNRGTLYGFGELIFEQSCNTQYKVVCEKKTTYPDAIQTVEENHQKLLTPATKQELINYMNGLKKDFESKVTQDTNFYYINNYFALSKKEIEGYDLFKNTTQSCPTGYELADLTYADGLNGITNYIASPETIEIMGHFLTQNPNINSSFWRRQDSWTYNHMTKYTKEQILERNPTGLSLSTYHWNIIDTHKSWNIQGRDPLYSFFTTVGSGESASTKRNALCQKTGGKQDFFKTPGNIKMLQEPLYIKNANIETSGGLLSTYHYNFVRFFEHESINDNTHQFFLPILREDGTYLFYIQSKQ